MNKEFYENKFYIHNGTEQQGPCTIEELKLQNIDLSTPIWFEGLNDWSTVGEIDDLKSILLNQTIENKASNKTIKNNKNKIFTFLNSKRIGLILMLLSIFSIVMNIIVYFNGFKKGDAPIIFYFSLIGCIVSTTFIIVTLLKKKFKLTYFIGLILFGASLLSIKIMESNFRTIVTNKWMKENLNVDKFRNGDVIPEAKSKEDWINASMNKQPIWCYYDYNPENGVKYGKLYNWYAVADSRLLAPNGWRVANSDDWWQLVTCWGELESVGSKLKSSSEWSNNGSDLNITGFSALPSGCIQDSGIPAAKGVYGYWWVDDRATPFKDNSSEYFSIWNGCDEVFVGYISRGWGYSVRCVKDY